MIRLQVVAPSDRTARVLELLDDSASATNVVVLRGAGREPAGDVIHCDVAREEVSDLVSDLHDLGVERDGSVAIGPSQTELSELASRARSRAEHAPDAVVWEEVEAQTSESAELSGSFVLFAIIAVLIAAFGIYLDSPILIIGAMIVGPDFGPMAGACVAAVNRQPARAARSLLALLVGYGLGIAAAYLATVLAREAGLIPERFGPVGRSVEGLIATPGILQVLVALLAGTAGMLSLTTAKSGTLVGVVVSVTTIPAAANIAVALAYAQGPTFRESVVQLASNVGAMLVAGTATLAVQRALYRRRREAHLRNVARRDGQR